DVLELRQQQRLGAPPLAVARKADDTRRDDHATLALEQRTVAEDEEPLVARALGPGGELHPDAVERLHRTLRERDVDRVGGGGLVEHARALDAARAGEERRT